MKRQDKSITLLENIIRKSMDEVMHESMMPYAEHVILERALPRAEDGLKPVQRRILYTMLELQLSADKPHRKSARIVGDCLGKYHPHGDSSVYDAMVRMAQPFNMELPLVDGHGNFGSVDGDSAAAMRYTEARMTTAAMQLLADIEKDTVSFSWNFDDTLKEPVLLPARFPNLLINGASGIAVGLATNMPPHNPREAIDAVIAQLEKPEISTRELMRILPGPDFPTGGFLMDTAEIERAYETGRGKLVMRAKTHFEEMKNGKTRIVITELPYQVNKAAALEKILQLSQEKKAMFAAIADIRDESDRQGMRAVIEIKKDGEPERVLQSLYKYSDLQCTFGANFVAIAEGKPQQLGLKQLLAYYISHRREVVTRRTRFELEAAKRREHILAGLMIAVDNVDEVIRLIRSSKTPKQAKEKLMDAFALSEIQAQAILDLRLQRLTNLELDTIRREYAEVVRLIARLESILASPKKLDALIKSELLAQRELFPQERRTQFIKESDIEPLPEPEPLPAEEMTVTLLEGFKLRKQPKRINSVNADEKALFSLCASEDSVLRLFMDNGSMVSVKLAELPETKPTGKPANLASVVELEKDESVVFMTADLGGGELLFVTDDGMIKRSAATEYAVKVKRTQAAGLKEGARLIAILPVNTDESCELMLVSRLGMCIRFGADSIPRMGRTAAGVKCMKLADKDSVFFVDKATDEGELLVLSDKGFGKRSFMFDYAAQGRNGTGVKTFDFKKNGGNGTRLVYAAIVREPLSLSLKQRHGSETCVTSEQLRIEPKASKGSLVVTCVLDDDVVEIRAL